jgi:hypothetical protein
LSTEMNLGTRYSQKSFGSTARKFLDTHEIDVPLNYVNIVLLEDFEGGEWKGRRNELVARPPSKNLRLKQLEQ